MSPKAMARPGGRSARVQEAVHAAVRELEAEKGRASLTVPAVAARAGVTPSTIYRRWGDLHELLSDVAVERLRPEEPPADHGASTRIWSPGPGNSSMRWPRRRDAPISVMRSWVTPTAAMPASARPTPPTRSRSSSRATGRGEAVPDVEAVMDHVVAPMMYRILFQPGRLTASYADHLVQAALTGP